jgi:hypothetical protein
MQTAFYITKVTFSTDPVEPGTVALTGPAGAFEQKVTVLPLGFANPGQEAVS